MYKPRTSKEIEESNTKAIEAAVIHYLANKADGIELRDDVIIVANYTLHSSQKRLFVYDLKQGKVIESYITTHGSGSAYSGDKGWSVQFSNTMMSKKSSLGSMKTGSIYFGKHGKSLKLLGLEPGINDAVYKRSIVIHSAKYATDRFVRENGRAGCSYGCLALDPGITSEFIDKYKEGVFVYGYYPV